MSLQNQMFQELADKKIFEKAKTYAYTYSDGIPKMDVYPSQENIDNLKIFEEPLNQESKDAIEVIDVLNRYGSPATTAQTGGRYFGFVDGGALPVSIAIKWLTDFWDQCGGLYLTSPINSKLESVCEGWLKDIFDLPAQTVAGFVSGTSMANLSALCAARYRLLKNQGWDINKQGLNGAPPIRIIAHRQVHSSVKKTLVMLGFGSDNIEWLDADDQGRAVANSIPALDNTCLLLLQAGNVNTGAYDPFAEICPRANEAGAWVHIDGAFGLWAGACVSLEHLTKGIELAQSWAVDGHKTLNTPYDSGIVMCADPEALVTSLQARADYIIHTDQREPLMYGPEMSKRSRALELWSVMKYLGKSGINEMVTGLHLHAKKLADGLSKAGFDVINEVVFNQVLIKCATTEHTKIVLEKVQKSGTAWCGGSMWGDEPVIRISVCSWATTAEDIDMTIRLFKESLDRDNST